MVAFLAFISGWWVAEGGRVRLAELGKFFREKGREREGVNKRNTGEKGRREAGHSRQNNGGSPLP